VNNVVADEVLALDRVAERLDPLNKRSSATVIAVERGVTTVPLTALGQRPDESRRPVNGIVRSGEAQPSEVKLKEPFSEREVQV
jgi:hypothetical protein